MGDFGDALARVGGVAEVSAFFFGWCLSEDFMATHGIGGGVCRLNRTVSNASGALGAAGSTTGGDHGGW